ncbi:semialdehyde dehydrogenase [Niastella koreensis]|uniref:Semialdehyde dehydrogenase NAD-binding protein n=2 Tax=Niastella koreensis TaxID=354356 RepID=G8TBW3_NIAKG|nr:NAD(P)H-binding protein [Niastella koreensis]AEV99256.1 Semialdehyde dehydrogenase NAD - binding protein [Niastella koreensis GR20-10]OQP46046.1 semialdehyde dehydrogenase [Niastella koreensis]
MHRKTAVVLGATGLIGQHLVQELLENEYFNRVRLLVRKPLTINHPKIDIQVVNFNDEKDIAARIDIGDVIFCCIGTTRKKVKGNKTEYRKVDYDIPIITARLGVQHGFSQFLLVSAVGANPVAANFYLQLKGCIEEDITALPFESIHIFRPSLLLGNRQEFRLGERIAQVVVKATSFLLIGAWRKYKPIQAADVAKSMVAAANREIAGVHMYEYDEMKTLIG